jgi:hypothetical protein
MKFDPNDPPTWCVPTTEIKPGSGRVFSNNDESPEPECLHSKEAMDSAFRAIFNKENPFQ